MHEDMKLLGMEARDAITGFAGIVTTISFDLYGCVQAIVTPKQVDPKKTEWAESRWFDTKRLIVTGKRPVMVVPTFVNVAGPQEKPPFPQAPRK